MSDRTSGRSCWHQAEIRLKPRPRGFHLITGELVAALPELARFKIGLANFFIQHTSASLAVNENADPDVRGDLARWFDRAVPENAPYFEHTAEGPDDMPAHVKATLLGASVTVPIREGRLALGTWQGIYLGEHRDHGGPRTIVVTLQGE
jgi:secondary thiamine-phosphate synthase enzyme